MDDGLAHRHDELRPLADGRQHRPRRRLSRAGHQRQRGRRHHLVQRDLGRAGGHRHLGGGALDALRRRHRDLHEPAGLPGHVVPKYEYAAFTGSWSSPQAIGQSGTQYYGPFAATIAATSAGATVSYFDGAANPVNTVTTSDLASSAWTVGATSSSATTPNIVGNGSNDVIPTAIVTLSGGTNQLLVYVDHNAAINFMTRTGVVTWPAPAVIAGCYTDTPVGLAPLANGDAILAFRGQDGNLYWTVYSHTSSSWSAVAAFSTPNVSVVDNDSAPVAVTHGIGGDTAEIAYVSSGKAYHARLTGSTWSTPVLVGGSSLTGVAIAAAP